MVSLLMFTGELVYSCTAVHTEVCMVSLPVDTGELVYWRTAVHAVVCMVSLPVYTGRLVDLLVYCCAYRGMYG